MTFEPQTWIAEQYLGRAEAGRTRPLRLFCSRYAEDETERDSAEYFAKFMGLPEITEQSMFSEMVGNALACAAGIATGKPAFIEINEPFSDFLHQVGVPVGPGVGVGSRNAGSGLGPPTYGRMTEDQRQDAARLYLFDLLVQKPRPA